MPAVFLFFVLVAVIVGAIVIGVTYFAAIAVFKAVGAISGGTRGGAVPGTTKKALRDARYYAKMIKSTAQNTPPGPMRDRLDRTVQPVDEWLVNLERLEQSLGKVYAQRNLTRELRQARFEIEQLRRDISVASAGEVASLRALMKSKRNYRDALEELQGFQNKAELKIRKIASDLGATHAEMLLITTRGDFSENRFQRLDENLQDNLSGLRDIMAAMDEMGHTREVVNYR